MNAKTKRFTISPSKKIGFYVIQGNIYSDFISSIVVELLFDACEFDVAKYGVPATFWLVPHLSGGIIRFDEREREKWDTLAGGTVSIWRPPVPILRRHAGRWLTVEASQRVIDLFIINGIQPKTPYSIDYWADGPFVKQGENRG